MDGTRRAMVSAIVTSAAQGVPNDFAAARAEVAAEEHVGPRWVSVGRVEFYTGQRIDLALQASFVVEDGEDDAEEREEGADGEVDSAAHDDDADAEAHDSEDTDEAAGILKVGSGEERRGSDGEEDADGCEDDGDAGFFFHVVPFMRSLAGRRPGA